jgi:hypothetical protein
MGERVNLNKHRKKKARAAAEKQADVNRRQFGRTRAEKEKDVAEAERRVRTLDGHKIDDDP